MGSPGHPVRAPCGAADREALQRLAGDTGFFGEPVEFCPMDHRPLRDLLVCSCCGRLSECARVAEGWPECGLGRRLVIACLEFPVAGGLTGAHPRTISRSYQAGRPHQSLGSEPAEARRTRH